MNTDDGRTGDDVPYGTALPAKPGGLKQDKMIHSLKRYGKIFGYVVLGAIVATTIYWLLVFAIIEPLRARSGRSQVSYLGIAYLILLPLALLFGSALTGFLCYPHLKTKLGLIGTAPGLYLSLAFTWANFTYGELSFAISMLLPGLIWVLVSWAGTRLGYSFRSRRNRTQVST